MADVGEPPGLSTKIFRPEGQKFFFLGGGGGTLERNVDPPLIYTSSVSVPKFKPFE